MKPTKERPGVDIPDAYNAFAQLVLAPIGVAVTPLRDPPAGRDWFELMDEHGLRTQWVDFVVTLTRAQALAGATEDEAGKLRKEFAARALTSTQRALFAVDVARVLREEMSDATFAKAYMLPSDEARAVFEDAPEDAGHVGIAARLSVAFRLFGDGTGSGPVAKKRERARDSFKKALTATKPSG